MKLYATTTSERASKGQGGNDYLEIEILGENKGVIGKIRVEVTKEYYSIVLGVPYREDGVISRESARRITKGKSCDCGNCEEHTSPQIQAEIEKTKGKSQKGEPREGLCHCGYPCIYGTDYCDRHQTP